MSKKRSGIVNNPFAVFEALAADAGYGQAEDQGMGNYYDTDPVEKRNLDRFINLVGQKVPKLGRKVFVAACGDGLETEVLIRKGFSVTATDFSPNMANATKRHLRESGLKADSVSVADVTNLNLKRMPRNFAGVSFAQAAQFIDDDKLPKAIHDLASLAPDGAFFMSTTQYGDPYFAREWAPNGNVVGSTVYRGRPLHVYEELCRDAGITIVHSEFFDAGSTPPDDYKNAYILGVCS